MSFRLSVGRAVRMSEREILCAMQRGFYGAEDFSSPPLHFPFRFVRNYKSRVVYPATA